jgi:hypothetical protein
MKKILCKLGFHRYEHIFTPFADQPFEDDPDCCVEGTHSYECKHCGETKPFWDN